MLGRFHLEEVVGLYALAFNLSMQTMILLSFNLDAVLLPGLSKLQTDPERQRVAFLNVVRTVTLVGVFASLLQAGLAEPGVHAVFPPRLYPLVPVIQLLSIGMAMRMGGWSSQTMLQAQGRFRSYMLLNVIGAVTFMTMVGIASWRAPHDQAPVYVAIAAALYFTIEGPAALYLAIRPGGGTWEDVFRTYAIPMIVAVAAIAPAVFVARYIPGGPGRAHEWVRIFVTLSISVPLFLLLARWLARDTWDSLVSRIKALRPSPAA
jgi:PST family polysaccharide transporter